ncbi:hypothetical protein [Nocardia niigatensis]|uniref:hypothetical protein n=1 Tax=Nocardia niigatensis TaxID=209249 RepID=UPI0002F1A99B|nr:hypothetical protein [Nocardia niigatensis]
MERLRRQLEALKAAEKRTAEPGDDSKITRLPRRPRRKNEEAVERPQQPWRPAGGSVYDPAPTRPVLRSELQRETGWWPVDPGPGPHAPASDPGTGEHDGSVIDLGAMRRKRAGDDAPVAGIRPVARPRRIGPAAGEGSAGTQDSGGDPDVPPPDGPARRH